MAEANGSTGAAQRSRGPLRLYINVDHVATVREARKADEPDPAKTPATRFQEKGGPDGIPGRPSHQLDAQPMMTADNNVSQQHYGCVDVADHQVGSPVVVQVPQCQASTAARMQKILSRT